MGNIEGENFHEFCGLSITYKNFLQNFMIGIDFCRDSILCKMLSLYILRKFSPIESFLL